MDKCGQRILVIGGNWALLEGVSDLLDLAGYQPLLSSTWAEVERLLDSATPDLVIVDLSSADPEAFRACARLRGQSPLSAVPMLLMSFTGLQHIHELRWSGGGSDEARPQFYVNTLLGPGTLLEKVGECLATEGNGGPRDEEPAEGRGGRPRTGRRPVPFAPGALRRSAAR